jgi:inner membrane protein
LGLAYIGVLSHPFLDWLNTYGVRVLMPFDGRWLYGDTLFILDPWLWLLMAASVVFVHSRAWFSIGLWSLLGLGASALVTLIPIIPLGAKILWWLTLAFIVGRRVKGVKEELVPWYGRACVVLFCLYLAAMFGGNSVAKSGVGQWLGEQGTQAVEIMAGPMPADPFSRNIVALSDEHYYFATVKLRPFQAPVVEERHERTRLPEITPIIEAAIRAESVRGLMNWIRYPHYTVETLDEGYRVEIIDLRYALPGERANLGQDTVFLDADLRPVQE